MKKHSVGAYVVLIILCIVLLLPIVITLIDSFATSWTGAFPNGWTLSYWEEMINSSNFWPSVGRSIVISILPVFISGFFVILTMYTSVLYYPWVDNIVQAICMLPHTLKGVILAIAVLAMYVKSNTFFSDRIIMLTFVYCVTILPYIYQGIKNNLSAINVHNLVEAAELLGASKFLAFFRVIVPNMISGILVSALLSMSILFSDFAIVNILAGSRYMTAQKFLYDSRNLPEQICGVISMLLFGIVLIISIVSFALENRSKRQKSMVKISED